MIDEYQFYEAKVIGANAILLITGILDDVQMKDFYQLTTELGLDALFEAHTEEQMDRALNCGARLSVSTTGISEISQLNLILQSV